MPRKNAHLPIRKHLRSKRTGANKPSEAWEPDRDEVLTWQNRPLESLYPILYLDGIVVKVHQDKRVMKKTVYVALGVNTEGQKELLGLWLAETEGSKFWLSVLTELQNRGVEDILMPALTD